MLSDSQQKGLTSLPQEWIKKGKEATSDF